MCALALFASHPSVAIADESCSGDDVPWVSLAFEGAGWDEAEKTEVLAHLRAGMFAQQFQVCGPNDKSSTPIATIVLSRDETERVAVTIDVRDDVTGKRVVRDVDLHRVPTDGRALGIAVAADELLRASWVELALADRPPPPQPTPPAVTVTVERSLAEPYRPRPKRYELGARATAEAYAGGQTHFGGELPFRAWFTEAFGFEAALGFKAALPVTSEHGTVEGVVTSGSAALLWNMTGPAWASLQAELGGSVAQVRLRGEANGNSLSDDGAALAAYGRGGAALAVKIAESVGTRLRGGAGAPISTVAATDDGRDVTAVSGLELYAGLEVHAAF